MYIYTTIQVIFPRETKMGVHEKNIQSSIIHNSIQMETTKMPIHKRMDEKLWYNHLMKAALWYANQYRGISKTICRVKEARHKTVHTVWFRLWNSRTEKLHCEERLFQCKDSCLSPILKNSQKFSLQILSFSPFSLLWPFGVPIGHILA